MGKPPLLHDKACPYKMMDYTYAYAVQVLRTHLLRRTTLRNGNKKTQAPADAGACVVSCWLKKEGEPKKMASLKKQMLPSARRVATCRGGASPRPYNRGRKAGTSAQTQLLAGPELRFGGEAVELAQLTHGDTVARCDAAQRVATAHSVVFGTRA